MSLSREVGASRKAQHSRLRAGSAEAQWSGTGEQALYAWGVDVIPGGGTGAGRMAMAHGVCPPLPGLAGGGGGPGEPLPQEAAATQALVAAVMSLDTHGVQRHLVAICLTPGPTRSVGLLAQPSPVSPPGEGRV